MDPLTHALSGALLARAAAQQPQSQPLSLPLRMCVAAGFAAAAFPDLDLVLRLIDTITYLNWHQGPTHSLVMLPVWAFLLSHLFSRLAHRQYRWPMFYLPVSLGIAIHIAGDLMTSYGLMLFSPFSTQRFSLPLAFVIDPWFSLIIVMGLVASLIFPQQRSVAICALIGLTGYVGFLWTLHGRAINIGTTYAKTQVISPAEVSALPQPLSPFNWKIIIRYEDGYHIARINLWHTQRAQQPAREGWLLQRMAAAYPPSTKISWQFQKQFGDDPYQSSLAYDAWQQAPFEGFRQFAIFPQLHRIDRTQNGTCFWFFDLRFHFPELPPSFLYGICRKNVPPEWEMLRQQGAFFID